MKKILESKNLTILLLSVLFIGLISCEDDGDTANNTETEEHAATKQKLIGEWRLVSRTIEGEALGAEDFSYLKRINSNF